VGGCYSGGRSKPRVIDGHFVVINKPRRWVLGPSLPLLDGRIDVKGSTSPGDLLSVLG